MNKRKKKKKRMLIDLGDFEKSLNVLSAYGEYKHFLKVT
jgi:hypothetical protein